MMQRLQERDDLDIRNFVVQMRTKRTLMVQNLVSTYADSANLSGFHMCRRLRSVFVQSGFCLETRFLEDMAMRKCTLGGLGGFPLEKFDVTLSKHSHLSFLYL